jgi:pimeloyl-ACP methyl ester carboxylesterase
MIRQQKIRSTTLLRSFGLLLGVVFLSHCSAPVSVHMEKPIAPALAPDASAGIEHHLMAIRKSQQLMLRGDASAVPAYNYSIARLVEKLGTSGANPWRNSLTISGTAGITSLKGHAPAGIAPQNAQIFPADTLAFEGKYAEHQFKTEGIGAPIVLVTSFDGIGHKEMRAQIPLRNFTAVVSFEGNSAILELLDPYQVDTVSLAGKTRPLAADFGAAMMLGLSKARIDKLGLARLLHPSRYNDTANLNFTQPYDPKRIPVLMVHGLDSTPATFAPMYFQLLQDPQLRKRYQFWVFSYPSGYPYPYSASLLRRELDEVKQEFPGHKNMVIIGHSMGSLISRLMVTDAGDKLWIKAFGRSPAQTSFTGNSKELLLNSLVFEDRKEIDRAIFFSGPHRGSVLATNWVGSIATRLIKAPGLIADVRNVAISAATADVAGLAMQNAPNSIGTLSPTNPFVVEINKLPIAPRVPFHSIVGDRGKGDTPNSSDGVVAYWSSHLHGADSEKIVPSGHGSHEHPEGIAEARRILHLHLK